jgi:ABC-2 type transport system ATP-binding protein
MSQPLLTVSDLVKSYNGFRAVDHLSFEAYPGQILGLLGPNGAGKTTTIRCAMDIFKPDGGRIEVLGQGPGEARSRVGYLPEERGLYRGQRVLDVLVYLAELKGVPRRSARRLAEEWLERVELTAWGRHKVSDLSRGMQQKVQFIASLVHDPDLLIFDEPFQGLDPVNVDLLKSLIRELQVRGKAIVLSAHEMSLVEALCDHIVLIDHGQAVLNGPLDEIQRQFSERTVRVRTSYPLTSLPGVASITLHDTYYQLALGEATAQEVLRELVRLGAEITSFEVAHAPLDEIFVATVREGKHV